jgi:hypothetical protein
MRARVGAQGLFCRAWPNSSIGKAGAARSGSRPSGERWSICLLVRVQVLLSRVRSSFPSIDGRRARLNGSPDERRMFRRPRSTRAARAARVEGRKHTEGGPIKPWTCRGGRAPRRRAIQPHAAPATLRATGCIHEHPFGNALDPPAACTLSRAYKLDGPGALRITRLPLRRASARATPYRRHTCIQLARPRQTDEPGRDFRRAQRRLTTA